MTITQSLCYMSGYVSLHMSQCSICRHAFYCMCYIGTNLMEPSILSCEQEKWSHNPCVSGHASLHKSQCSMCEHAFPKHPWCCDSPQGMLKEPIFLLFVLIPKYIVMLSLDYKTTQTWMPSIPDTLMDEGQEWEPLPSLTLGLSSCHI